MMYQAREWSLGDVSISVTVPAPVRLSREHIARLRRYVDALEAEASICWDDGQDEKLSGNSSPVPRSSSIEPAPHSSATDENNSANQGANGRTRTGTVLPTGT